MTPFSFFGDESDVESESEYPLGDLEESYPDSDEELVDDDDPKKQRLDDPEHSAWIAGVIARACERGGLIRQTDNFSHEWHEMFGDDWAAMKAETASKARDVESALAPAEAPALPAPDASAAIAAPVSTPSTSSAPAPAASFGDAGFSSSFGFGFGG